MKPTKDQLQKYYAQALQRSLTAYAQLSDKEWDKKASDSWTAKDYLAHLVVSQTEEVNPHIRQTLNGEESDVPRPENRYARNDFNEQQLAKLRQMPASELLPRLKAAIEENLAILGGLSEADLDKPATSTTWDRPGTVRDLFFGSYLHLPGHYQDIRRVSKKKLPHWVEAGAPDEVNFQMGRIFNFMPLIYQSERGGDMQATYLFTMEGDGGGQWAISINDGHAIALDGPPESFDTEIRTKPEFWIDLSSNDLNPMWAITTRKVHLGGNASLAMKLGQLFSVDE
ncbi:MAG: SCP2 sterol-binding domain-containing protein [Dehalococcoidia bacterium]